jgi:hypothetical protein
MPCETAVYTELAAGSIRDSAVLRASWAAIRRPPLLRASETVRVVFAQPALQSAAEPSWALHAQGSAPVLLPSLAMRALRLRYGDDMAQRPSEARQAQVGRCPRGCSSPRIVRRCLCAAAALGRAGALVGDEEQRQLSRGLCGGLFRRRRGLCGRLFCRCRGFVVGCSVDWSVGGGAVTHEGEVNKDPDECVNSRQGPPSSRQVNLGGRRKPRRWPLLATHEDRRRGRRCARAILCSLLELSRASH